MLCLAPALLKTGFLAATAEASSFWESWPGLSRPSTSYLLSYRKKDVDARDKRGHDDADSFPGGAVGMQGRRTSFHSVEGHSTDPDQKSSLLAIGIL